MRPVKETQTPEDTDTTGIAPTPHEKRSALHRPLQFLHQRRQFGFRLGRAFAIKRFEPNLDHLLL